MTTIRTAALAGLLLLGPASPSFAQHDQHDHTSPKSGWIFSFDAQAFFNLNLQERKFRDFHVAESQNWLMASASRSLGGARFSLHGMLSAEPWTLRAIGSPQVFQTGETYQRLPLIDYQHPHDLVMGATARLDWPMGASWRWHLEGGPVGAPAIGPPAYMHRASAGPNPTAPLGHHQLDSTHISHTVLTLGATRGGVTIDASAFHGREPDEDRVTVEQGPIDSYAARLSWRRGRWSGQGSWAEIAFPDATEFTDHRLITASASFDGAWRRRPLVATLAVGLLHETASRITLPASLVEAAWQTSTLDQFYARGEFLLKNILSAGGYHPPGFFHEHTLSKIAALTIGYERRIVASRFGAISVGGDATVYAHDATLDDNYGTPFSAHLFGRYAFHK